MLKKPFIRIFGLMLILIGLSAGTAWAQSILIFSTSHSNTGPSKIKEAEGVMKLVVSSFSPIREIQINGEISQAQPGTSISFEVPYSLKKGENSFIIKVVTAKAEGQKDFILNYIEPEAKEVPAKKPFQLIAVAGLIYTDNVTAVKEDKKSDTKLSLTAIPQYRQSISPDSDLLVQAIIMREKFSDSKYEALETVFTQVDGKFMKESGFGDWQVTAGANDIGGKTEGFGADTKVETNIFVGGAVQLNALDDKNVSLGMKYTLKNAEDPAHEDYDRDGSLFNINAAWKRKISGINGKLTGDYDFNDAKGLYNDSTAYGIGVGGKYPLDKQLTLSGKLDIKSTSYKESDPLKGDKETYTLSTLSVGGSYKIPGLSGFIAVANLTAKQQSSNITSREYSENLVGVSLIYIY